MGVGLKHDEVPAPLTRTGSQSNSRQMEYLKHYASLPKSLVIRFRNAFVYTDA
jgi:hypothetical protein